MSTGKEKNMTHYLVDYENVHEGGMKGIRNLKEDCTVHIFYTRNACRIKMDSLLVPDHVMLHFIQVAAGKQQADMHIISFLGYLIGKYGNEEEYVIVSLDRDYDKAIEFWNARPGIGRKIIRSECIGESVTPDVQTGNATNVFHKPAAFGNTEIRFNGSEKKEDNSSAGSTGKARKALVNKLKSQGIKRSEAEFAVNAILENKFNKNYKQKVHDCILKKYGYKNGKRIYRSIFKLLPKQSSLSKIA